jgi:hypothetical protein
MIVTRLILLSIIFFSCSSMYKNDSAIYQIQMDDNKSSDNALALSILSKDTLSIMDLKDFKFIIKICNISPNDLVISQPLKENTDFFLQIVITHLPDSVKYVMPEIFPDILGDFSLLLKKNECLDISDSVDIEEILTLSGITIKKGLVIYIVIDYGNRYPSSFKSKLCWRGHLRIVKKIIITD